MSQSRLNAVFIRQRISLLRTLQGLVRNAGVAEELLHETWLRVCKALGERPVEHLEPFIFQTARNLAFDHLRAQRRHVRAMDGSLSLDALHDVPEPRSGAEEIANAERTLRRLSASVARLTPRQRNIFVRNRVHGQTYLEIAHTLGVSASTVQKELKLIMQVCVEAVDG